MARIRATEKIHISNSIAAMGKQNVSEGMANTNLLTDSPRGNLMTLQGFNLSANLTFDSGIGSEVCGAGELAGREKEISGLATAREVATITGDEALQKLMDGNQRYVEQKRFLPHQTFRRHFQVASGQHPLAIVLSCADLRVSPELLFDQKRGDLLEVRVARNRVDAVVLANIEFAAEELGVPLVMVLGYEGCGAAIASSVRKPVPGHIGSLVDAIKPFDPPFSTTRGGSEPAVSAVYANIQLVVEQLISSSPIISELVQAGKLKIVGARYDLGSGVVEAIA